MVVFVQVGSVRNVAKLDTPARGNFRGRGGRQMIHDPNPVPILYRFIFSISAIILVYYLKNSSV